MVELPGHKFIYGESLNQKHHAKEGEEEVKQQDVEEEYDKEEEEEDKNYVDSENHIDTYIWGENLTNTQGTYSKFFFPQR